MGERMDGVRVTWTSRPSGQGREQRIGDVPDRQHHHDRPQRRQQHRIAGRARVARACPSAGQGRGDVVHGPQLHQRQRDRWPQPARDFHLARRPKAGDRASCPGAAVRACCADDGGAAAGRESDHDRTAARRSADADPSLRAERRADAHGAATSVDADTRCRPVRCASRRTAQARDRAQLRKHRRRAGACLRRRRIRAHQSHGHAWCRPGARREARRPARHHDAGQRVRLRRRRGLDPANAVAGSLAYRIARDRGHGRHQCIRPSRAGDRRREARQSIVGRQDPRIRDGAHGRGHRSQHQGLRGALPDGLPARPDGRQGQRARPEGIDQRGRQGEKRGDPARDKGPHRGGLLHQARIPGLGVGDGEPRARRRRRGRPAADDPGLSAGPAQERHQSGVLPAFGRARRRHSALRALGRSRRADAPGGHGREAA